MRDFKILDLTCIAAPPIWLVLSEPHLGEISIKVCLCRTRHKGHPNRLNVRMSLVMSDYLRLYPPPPPTTKVLPLARLFI